MTGTATTEDALQLLRTHRAALIARAREVAQAIARQRGTVISREVRAVMVAEGSYVDTGDDRWLGAVFSRKVFESDGLVRANYADSPRNTHPGNYVQRWKLR